MKMGHIRLSIHSYFAGTGIESRLTAWFSQFQQIPMVYTDMRTAYLRQGKLRDDYLENNPITEAENHKTGKLQSLTGWNRKGNLSGEYLIPDGNRV